MSKVLVIDENLEVRENTVELLEYEGFSVASSSDGSAGYEKTQIFMPDLILCDLVMTDTDGMHCYHLLKSNSLLSNIPIVFLTADNTSNIDAIPNDVFYLIKPFTSEELLDLIELTIGKNDQVSLS